MKLATRIILMLTLLAFTLGGISIYLVNQLFSKELTRTDHIWSDTLLSVLSESLAYDAINKNILHATETIQSLVDKNENIAFVYILGFEGEIFAHTFSDGFPKKTLDLLTNIPQLKSTRTYILDGLEIEEASYPIIEGLPARIYLGLNHFVNNQYLDKIQKQMLFSFAIIGGIGVIFIFLISRRIAGPLEQISRRMKRYAEREKDSQQATVYRYPEIEQVSRAFNDMITARNKAETEQRASDEQRQLLLNSTVEAIYGIDLEGRCTFANSACVHMLGYDNDDELLGQNMHYLIHHTKANGSPCEEEDCLIYSTYKQGILVHIDDEIFWRKDGSSFPVEYWSHPFTNKSDIEGCVVTFFDITERRQAEDKLNLYRDHLEQIVDQRTRQLEASNRELESYSYSIAHDLRAPLRTIISFSQIVQEEAQTKLSPDELVSLERIVKAGKYMANLIDDILELSRISRREINKVSVDVSALTHKVISRIQQTNISRKVIWQVEEGLQAEADPQLLNIVLENLLGNAWKFTSRQTQPRVELSQKNHHGETAFYVADNGVGFDMRYADKLFGVFERLHAKEDFEGTGVGLATVQRIIHRLGGRIWAEAEPNKGATFYFTLK